MFFLTETNIGLDAASGELAQLAQSVQVVSLSTFTSTIKHLQAAYIKHKEALDELMKFNDEAQKGDDAKSYQNDKFTVHSFTDDGCDGCKDRGTSSLTAGLTLRSQAAQKRKVEKRSASETPPPKRKRKKRSEEVLEAAIQVQLPQTEPVPQAVRMEEFGNINPLSETSVHLGRVSPHALMKNAGTPFSVSRHSLNAHTQSPHVRKMLKENCRKDVSFNGIEGKDQTLLKQMGYLLDGVPPPCEYKTVKFSSDELLSLYRKNQHETNYNFKTQNPNEKNHQKNMLPSHLDGQTWPALNSISAYGVHYNRSKYSEKLEFMYSRIAERYIGEETGTSFVTESSQKAV